MPSSCLSVQFFVYVGATENARHENTGRSKTQDLKMRDQFAGVENAGKVSMDSQSVKVSQSSCICMQSYSFSTSLFDKITEQY